MRILLADDEWEITRALKIMLERSQYTVDVAEDGAQALDYLENGSYDAVVLDVMMPQVDGLTAKADIDDRVAGLDAGADDYLPKPFSSQEFLARVRALLRRRPSYVQEQLSFGDLTLDTGSCLLTCGSHSMRLGGKEFQILELLLRNTGVILSAATFLERIWGFDSDTEMNVVWVHIAYLRKHLASIHSRVTIQSIRGVGYTLEDGSC
ncbi:MAG TPA: response regulator transcription factor [Candidatus Avoscillospira avistercoris]|uniref:Stage 0 sporulation protein A homolog n=1 Tax=Candidatus Avoscillospira avistercoris TaxID=2840707 RepID=A0A9D1FA40_9FIRM|nr:response regulator transcription factor [Candidatus Avoscillospira avistercoris]